MITLTKEEKERFIMYLEQEAQTAKELAEELLKLGASGPTEVLSRMERHIAAACRMIAKHLQDGEEARLA